MILLKDVGLSSFSCQVGINSFEKEDWFRNYLNDCKVNLRVTPINSWHVGFLRSDEAYAINLNMKSGSRFNFDMLCPRDNKDKET